jgi:aminoglycoside phosphotransferase (APT) family kinase protein
MPANDSYDEGEVRARLEPWLAARYGAPVTIDALGAPGASGFSSETMLLDLTVGSGGETTADRIVIRGEPMAFRVFPTYDLLLQYRVMDAVRTHSKVPMPELKWFEGDESILGHPFYVMERIDGDAPPDNLPYTIDGFVHDAAPEDQARLYRSAVTTLADLHAIDPVTAGLDFLSRPEDGPTGLDQQLAYYERYIPYAMDGGGHPVLEPIFQWLIDRKPSGLPEVLSWGDSRLGNMLFRDFEVAAVLDWEMAYLGPREQDVAWFFYFVRFFSDMLGLPNLPGFPTEAEGLAIYEAASGHTLEHFDWFLAWAAFRYAVVLVRLLHRPAVRENTPAEWTLIDNPWVRGASELTGIPIPEA